MIEFKRKIIQIVHAPETHEKEGGIIALADDGSLWGLLLDGKKGPWERVGGCLPQAPSHEYRRLV
jgi:hypothetical protein